MAEPRPTSFDAPLGRRIIDLHVWAVRQGLSGTAAEELFAGFCRRLADAGVPLWRAFAAMRTLHPQWGGYGYSWQCEQDAIELQQFGRRDGPGWLRSPFAYLLHQANTSSGAQEPWLHLRRHLTGPDAQLDFPVLEELAADGGSDYFAEIVGFGAEQDPSYGTGVAYSFATDRPGGFYDDDLALLQAILPALSLAMMSYAGHTIASSLLAAYLGSDAGRRVHSGAIERGSVESLRAVLWYADIRGFTAIADATAGGAVVELLDEIFETLTASLRRRGGQVLKFMGDGMLATFPLGEKGGERICREALDAAAEAQRALDRLSFMRAAAGKPVAEVDIALHIGEVLYGNVGAVDRLDFTVIGPAVNEVSRIETLCEPLGHRILVSAELAAAVGDSHRLEPLGSHQLRGVSEPRAIYALKL
jgi:adenylate cyclase